VKRSIYTSVSLRKLKRHRYRLEHLNETYVNQECSAVVKRNINCLGRLSLALTYVSYASA